MGLCINYEDFFGKIVAVCPKPKLNIKQTNAWTQVYLDEKISEWSKLVIIVELHQVQNY